MLIHEKQFLKEIQEQKVERLIPLYGRRFIFTDATDATDAIEAEYEVLTKTSNSAEQQ